MNGSKTAGHGAPFYPQSLERGRRSSRAVMLAVAEMYVKGVSNRDAEAVMQEFGIESLPSAPVSRAAKLLDAELEAWRNRHRGEIRYLILDARYEKVREGGWVRDAAVLSAIGMGPGQRRRVLGVSCALCREVPWQALESLPGHLSVCAASHSWSPTTLPACAPPERRSSVAPSGNAVRSIWHKTPPLMRPVGPSAGASAPNCVRSGTPRIGQPQQQSCAN